MNDEQISETTRMARPEDEDTTVTDEGIPPAEDTGHIPQGPPKSYGPRGQGRSPLKEAVEGHKADKERWADQERRAEEAGNE